MTKDEENESVESNDGRDKKVDGWSAVEDGDGKVVKDESKVELPLKNKRNMKGRKTDSSNKDDNSTDAGLEKNGEKDETVVNGIGDVRSRRSRMTESMNSSVNYNEQEIDDEDDKVVTKKSGNALRKKNTKKSGRKSKQGKGKKGSSNTKDTNENEPDYEVEKIINVKYNSNGKREFLLRWKGFTAKDDTWEPEENLDCKDLIKEYFKNKESQDEESDEDEEKLSGLRKKVTESSGTRTRTRGGGNRNSESHSKKSQERPSRSSSRVSKGSISTITIDDEEEEEAQSRRGKGADNKRKRESESESTSKSKRTKKDQDKENVDETRVPASEEDEAGDSGMEDAAEYEVQKIVDVRYRKNGTREFFIKWRGFSSSHNSWEPEKHLNCSDKLQEFLQELEKVSSMPMRQLRDCRKKTDRLVLESPRGRKLSTRLQRQPRKSYIEMD